MRFLLLALLIFSVTCLRNCTIDDFAPLYTPCDQNTNTRQVVYYKKTQCHGGYEPPISTKKIPCDIQCKNGYYLAPPAEECQPCKPGYYSFSEGLRIDKFDENTTKNLRTECTPPGKCSLWQKHGKYIDSGDQEGRNSIVSTLSLTLEIIRPNASITYIFKVDAEKGYDGLKFYIDQELMKPLMSYTYGYLKATFPLSQGYHKVEWKYVKNEHITRGKDRAYIRLIEIYGAKAYDEECLPCPKGTFSVGGQANCTPCAINTFAKDPGSKECTPCPAGMYAEFGAEECKPRPKCTQQDYYSFYTPCKKGTRTLKYAWLQPKICDGGVTLPKDEGGKECEKCPPGFYHNTTSEDWNCIACPDGYAFNGQKCEKCPKGTVAIKTLRYENFNPIQGLPEGWKTQCAGICSADNNGWRVISDPVTKESYLDSGSQSYGQTTIFTFQINLYMPGKIQFDYEIFNKDPDPESAFLSFYVGKYIATFGKNSSEATSTKDYFISKNIPPGTHDVMFVFQKEESYDNTAKAIIRSIIIEGDERGSADKCKACTAGYQCIEGSKQEIPCPPGTFSTKGSEKCKKCPANTFSKHKAQSKCERCGKGTFSQEGSTECINSCVFKVDGTKIVYNLTELDRSIPFKFNTDDMEELKFRLCGKINCTTIQRTYSCVEAFHKSWDLGNTATYQPLSGEDVRKGLKVIFSNGYQCDDGPLKTIVELSCNPIAGIGQPILVSSPELFDSVCDMEYVQYFWESHAACPLCTEEDIVKTESACINGKRTTSYYYKQPQTCFGGVKLPDVKVTSCSDVTLQRLTAVLIGGTAGFIFVVLAGSFVVLYRRHQSLYRNYTLLTEKNAKEINLVDSDSDTSSSSEMDQMELEEIIRKAHKSD